MKKIFQFIILCAMSVALVGCDELKKNAGESPSEDYTTAIKNNDYEKAHSIINDLKNRYHEELKAESHNLDSSSGMGDVLSVATEYTDAMAAVYSAEARFIMAEGGENAQDRLVYLFNEIPVVGQKIADGTELDTYDPNSLQVALYRLYCQTINQLCNTVFDISINKGDKKLTAIALSHYLDIPSGDHGSSSGKVTYSSEAKDNAQKRFDEAVKNGLFD